MSEIVKLLLNGEERAVEVLQRERSAVRFRISGREYQVEFVPALAKQSSVNAAAGQKSSGVQLTANVPPLNLAAGSAFQVNAPIPGVIVEVVVEVGAQVAAGALLVRLEAMKMQNAIFSPAAGIITRIAVEAGKEVLDGELLLELKAG